MSWHSVRGHDRIVASLRSNLRNGRLPHAFLFIGPDGVGKRTFARKLAQALLCERNPETLLDPCGACPGCVQAEAGTHPDLMEVGRPENRAGIAHPRDPPGFAGGVRPEAGSKVFARSPSSMTWTT